MKYSSVEWPTREFINSCQFLSFPILGGDLKKWAFQFTSRSDFAFRPHAICFRGNHENMGTLKSKLVGTPLRSHVTENFSYTIVQDKY